MHTNLAIAILAAQILFLSGIDKTEDEVSIIHQLFSLTGAFECVMDKVHTSCGCPMNFEHKSTDVNYSL